MSHPQQSPTHSSLQGKRALVTGAGRRVGAAIARRLGADKMSVAVHYCHSRAGAEETCEAIERQGGRAWAVQADLYRPGAAAELLDRTVEHWGGMDLLVPSAANFDRVAFADIEPEHWDRAHQLNLRAPFEMAHRAASALQKSGGAIVFITCTSVSAPYRSYLPYEVSKAGLRQLMRVLALELAPHVRVNAVAPGNVMPPENLDEQSMRRLEEATPLQVTGRAADVAEAVHYLARSSFVTGHELVVDGGRILASALTEHP